MVALTWGLLVISTAVVVICTALVVVGAWRRRVQGVGDAVGQVPVERGASGLGWISIGVGISFIALLGSLIWTVIVLAAVNGPPSAPKVTIEVTGLQWWWKARYLSEDPSRIFTTANEIHIPTGEPVQVRLIAAPGQCRFEPTARADRRRQPLGCGHARMVDAVTAAAL